MRPKLLCFLKVVVFQVLSFLPRRPIRKCKNPSARPLTKEEIQKFLDTLEDDDGALTDSNQYSQYKEIDELEIKGFLCLLYLRIIQR